MVVHEFEFVHEDTLQNKFVLAPKKTQNFPVRSNW